ncbi:MAG TPA: methyltransferase domain-containing protein [Gammaproteobacteria bacterium]|nr:methyltransferase domain-containing protein [Gammaproteobacteria bacterium]
MTDSPDQRRWDERYRDTLVHGEPCRVLEEHAHLLPAQGRALDLACGTGGNALFLAAHGLDTEAWDVSPVALEKLADFATQKGLKVHTRACDLTRETPPENSFDVIVVSRYLQRDLCPAIAVALRPRGLLYYQTFVRDKVSDAGPSNPEWRLAENELLQLFPSLVVRTCREEGRCGDLSKGFRDEAWLVAQRPATA